MFELLVHTCNSNLVVIWHHFIYLSTITSWHRLLESTERLHVLHYQYAWRITIYVAIYTSHSASKLVCHCLATKLFIGKLPAAGWVLVIIGQADDESGSWANKIVARC